jgi:sugar diacid utilization regulator
VAEWQNLGVYRMLGTASGDLHPGVERLLDDRQHEVLLETLETYLDLAGSVVATAKALGLHLSLKLARLTGRYRPR